MLVIRRIGGFKLEGKNVEIDDLTSELILLEKLNYRDAAGSDTLRETGGSCCERAYLRRMDADWL